MTASTSCFQFQFFNYAEGPFHAFVGCHLRNNAAPPMSLIGCILGGRCTLNILVLNIYFS